MKKLVCGNSFALESVSFIDIKHVVIVCTIITLISVLKKFDGHLVEYLKLKVL